MRSRKSLLAASILFPWALAVSAQSQPFPDDGENFGTEDGIDLWIPASQFVGIGFVGGPSAQHWACCVPPPEGQGYYFSDSGLPYAIYEAPMLLPQGAHMDAWAAFFYDGSASSISVSLLKYYDDTSGSPEPGKTVLRSFSSTGTPGFKSNLEAMDLTIDLREPSPSSGIPRNLAADFYTFQVQIPSDLFLGFKGVRVYWHRQVSPAPRTATFNDVPTSDPAFQYIEAVAASGITAGCSTSPPLYCPDATLTRRQMAVFLSKALGLHWPPF